MINKTRGIVLRNIDYSDSSIITRIFTEQWGMQAYLVRGAKGKKAAIKPSQLMPLTLVELVVYHKPGTSLQSIRELKCSPMLQRVHFEVPRSSVALFCSELLSKCLPEEEHPDEAMFEFLFHYVQVLDKATETLPYLPVFFILQLAGFLGFSPKENYSELNPYFDIDNGIFSSRPGPLHLDQPISATLSDLLNRDLQELPGMKLSRDTRSELLDTLIRYLEIHLPGSPRIKSHLILKEVFD